MSDERPWMTKTMLLSPPYLEEKAKGLEKAAEEIYDAIRRCGFDGDYTALALLGAQLTALAKFCTADKETDQALALMAYEIYWTDQFKKFEAEKRKEIEASAQLAALLHGFGFDPKRSDDGEKT